MEANLEACVVLPAGGCGERFGTSVPKQYCEIQGQPLIVQSILIFHNLKWIKEIVVAVSQQHKNYVQMLLKEFHFHKVTMAEGASTRHRSIFNGLLALSDSENICDVVIIHDAVRPFVQEQTIFEVAMAAQKHGAAGVICPLVSTVVAEDSDGFLDVSLDRNKYRASEMPQAFKLNEILKAYRMATDYDLDYGTECLLFAKKYAQVPVKLISGPRNLWKVTHRKDIYAVEGVMKEEGLSVKIVNCFSEKLQNLIQKEMTLKNIRKICQHSDASDPELANSYIFCYNSPNWKKLEEDTRNLFAAKHKAQAVCTMRYVVIHVINSENVDEILCSWRRPYRKLAEEGKQLGVLINGIIISKVDQEIELSKWIIANIWTREDAMFGYLVGLD